MSAAAGLLQQVGLWNATCVPVDPVTIDAMFACQLARDPNHPALYFQGETVSYGQLEQRANRVAQLLRSKGIARETLVGVMVERTPDMVYAMLGILKAGAAYVPIDPDYPSARIQYLLEDSGCELLLTDRSAEMHPELQFHGPVEQIAAVVRDDAPLSDALLSDELIGDVRAGGGPRDLAYVIYTSGSTGKPKGAMVEHRGIINFISFYRDKFAIMPHDRIVQFASISFAASVSEIFMALLTGATLYLVPKSVILNHRQFEDYLLEHRISIATLPPHYIVELDPQRNVLRVVLTAGSPANWNTVDKWRSHVTYYNAYGTSETSVGVSTFNASVVPRRGKGVPIGSPNNNTRFYILDEHGALAAPLQPGELCVSGVCVGRGYHKRAELTAQKFVSNPFEPGERMYRTGDLAIWHEDGNVEILGRIDDQVKINGHRIEPDEIAALLLQNEMVDDAVVITQNVNGEARLCAYCVAPSLENLDPVREYVALRLPDYMRPAFFVQIDAIPININGKLDKPALPDPRAANLNRVAWQAPRNPNEEVLAGVWRQVLGLSAGQLGIFDNFFHLGGDSVGAIQIVSHLFSQGYLVEVADIFQCPTIAALAPLVAPREAGGANAVSAAANAAVNPSIASSLLPDARRSELLATLQKRFPNGPALEIDTVYPLSPLQYGMYFHHFGPDPGAYFVQCEFVVDGALDPACFEASVGDLVARHEILRAVFTHRGLEQPLQVILASLPPDYAYRDLSAQAGLEPDAWFGAWLAQDQERGLRLEQECAIRFRLFKFGPQSFRVYIAFHHIILDGWCIGVIWDALRAAYRARLEGEPARLGPAPGYGGYLAWLERQDHGAALAYWRGVLDGYATRASLANPAILARSALRPGAEPGFHTFQWNVDTQLVQDVAALCKRYQLTLNTVLKGCWALLLQRHTNTRDVVFGEVNAGRPPHLQDASSILGLFINTVPVRVRTGPQDNLVQLLRKVQEGTLAGQKHQFVSLAEIQAQSVLRGALLDHLLVFENFPDLEGQAGGQAAWKVRAGRVVDRTNYPLTVTVLPRRGITIEFLFDERFHELAGIERIAHQLHTLLLQAVAHPLQSVGAMDPFARNADAGPAMQGELLARPALGIHQLFEARAAAMPEQVALRMCLDLSGAPGQRSLTPATLSYAALNAQANKIAHYLAAAGVGPGRRVAILLERSPEFIASLLGVLKTGAAYVPIDHNYPAARVQRILDVADPGAIITRSAFVAQLAGRVGVVNLDQCWHAVQDAPASNLERACQPWDLAQVLFTSGTTGKPKGVMLSHRGLVNHALFLQEQLGLTPDDVVLQFAALGFDALNEEIFPALVTGARVVLRPADMLDSFERLEHTLLAEGISVLDLPTSYWNQWVDWLAGDRFDLARAPRLRRLIVGGEAISAKHVALWQGRWPNLGLVNSYGPTETTVISTWYPVPAHGGNCARIPLGQPLSNTALYILGADGRPAGPGRPGELFISGAGVALGYLDEPALSAERFVPAPDGAPMYRTGDWVELNERGELHYLGRMDNQVKLRGFRIELDEVKQALLSHVGVRQAQVCVEGEGAHAQLVAYLQLAAPLTKPFATPLTAPLLRRYLRERLPAQLVPNRFNQVASWPLTGNGKIDHGRLRECCEPMAGGQANGPQTPLQQRLCAIWEAVLDAPVPDIALSFLELGGHSLQVVGLLARMRAELGIEVSMAGLSRHPTIEQLALHIEGGVQGESNVVHLTAAAADASALPLFVVHPIGGGVFCYRNLAAVLEGQRMVYGLQCAGLDSARPLARSIAAMASDYIAAIQGAQPHGPYCLAGWSMGGQIAQEIACQLRQRGEPVQLLLLIDSWHPALIPEGDSEAGALADFVGDLLASGGHDPAGVNLRGVAGAPACHALLQERGLIPADMTQAQFQMLFEVYRNNLHAMLTHSVSDYDGPALLLQAGQAGPGRDGAVHGLGWATAISGLEVQYLDGDHYSQMSLANAETIAALLQAPPPSTIN